MTESPFLSSDVTTRARAVRESIAAKQATAPKVDAQGQPTEPVIFYRYDRYGQLIGPADEQPKDAE